MVELVLARSSVKVLGEGEGAHDPAVSVDYRDRNPDTLVHHALDRRLGLVDVGVGRHEDACHRDEGKSQLLR